MFITFKKYISEKTVLSDRDWAIIKPLCIIKKLRKQQYLLQEGEIWKYHAFVCEGCLRRYSIDEKGIEHIIQFVIENWWAGDRESLANETPSRYNIDAIENSAVLLIRKDNFDIICKKIPEFNELMNTILQRSLNASQLRIEAAISFTAEEKYLHFIKSFPNIANRVPRRMLASYLSITPETLSKIKNQITKK
ncbi:MAG: Crp/Fnr family transcriptional regulator [Bacteroidota bacterium]